MNKIIISIYIFQKDFEKWKNIWRIVHWLPAGTCPHLPPTWYIWENIAPPSPIHLMYLEKTLQLVYLSDFATIISPNQFQSQKIKFSSGATIFNLFS